MSVVQERSNADGRVTARRRRATRVDLRAGDVLDGRYTLLAPLGEGGMGDVWRARNPTLEMDVALKVLRVDEQRADTKTLMMQRLLFEARATAKLGHPAIVRIIDFGETPSGNGFYVMELLEGEDLASLIGRYGRLSAVKAVRTLLPIASALAMAHSREIIHRDLKPDNIFLARDRDRNIVQPKLIDFGIAKLGQIGKRITVAGTLMGSPGYMAPEQTRGEDVDARADVWGFSVVLYETLTGRLPFDGRNFFALARSIAEDEPQAILACAPGDDTLWSIIQRGLEKDPTQRWGSMHELGRALAHWLLERGVAEDISGAPLPAAWLQEAGDPSPPEDPFVSAPVPARMVEAARLEVSERTSVVAPPPARTSEAPRLPQFPIRSRGLSVAAVVLGIGAGIAGAAWGLRHSAMAARVESAALMPEVATDARPIETAPGERAVERAVEPAVPVLETPVVQAETTASAKAPRPRRGRATPKTSPAPAVSVPVEATASQVAPVALPRLKNPFDS